MELANIGGLKKMRTKYILNQKVKGGKKRGKRDEEEDVIYTQEDQINAE